MNNSRRIWPRKILRIVIIVVVVVVYLLQTTIYTTVAKRYINVLHIIIFSAAHSHVRSYICAKWFFPSCGSTAQIQWHIYVKERTFSPMRYVEVEAKHDCGVRHFCAHCSIRHMVAKCCAKNYYIDSIVFFAGSKQATDTESSK